MKPFNLSFPGLIIMYILHHYFMQMALLSALKQIAGTDSCSISQAFMPEFFRLVLGTLSLPIDLPGTNYRQGVQVIDFLRT